MWSWKTTSHSWFNIGEKRLWNYSIWTDGEPITVPEPYKTYKRPIGGLTFKDEIPELVQADTSTEGDTAEPRLIIPSTSGRDSRDRTAGVILAWYTVSLGITDMFVPGNLSAIPSHPLYRDTRKKSNFWLNHVIHVTLKN